MEGRRGRADLSVELNNEPTDGWEEEHSSLMWTQIQLTVSNSVTPLNQQLHESQRNLQLLQTLNGPDFLQTNKSSTYDPAFSIKSTEKLHIIFLAILY